MRNSIFFCVTFSFLLAFFPGCQSAGPAEPEPAEEAATDAPPEPAQVEGEVVASGTFEGRSDHEVSGGVSIVETDAGFVLRFGSDFSLDGAPAPEIGFGSDGYDAATRFAKLEELTGEQTYPIPETIDPAAFNEVWVWCTRFDVPLGVATLQR